MIKIREYQHGFSPVWIVAVLLVVVVVGFGGWIALQKGSESTSVQKNSDTSSKQQAKVSQNTDPRKSGDLSEGGKYLVIKEWGVRFELPQVLKGDVLYGLASTQEGTMEPGSMKIASFEIGSVAKSVNGCRLTGLDTGEGAQGGIGVTLIRVPVDSPALPGLGSSFYTTSDGRYKFYGTTMHALCASEDENLQLKSGKYLSDAFASLEEY